MGVPLDLSPIGVHKSSGVSQASAKERLELVPGDRGSVVSIVFLLVLLPAEADLVLKEGRSKGDLVSLPSSSNGKVVLTLLTEVVGFHMGISAVHVWRTAFKGLS